MLSFRTVEAIGFAKSESWRHFYEALAGCSWPLEEAVEKVAWSSGLYWAISGELLDHSSYSGILNQKET